MRSAPDRPVRELLRRYAAAWLESLPAGADALLVDAFAGRDHPGSSGAEPEAIRAVGEASARLARRGEAERVAWLLLEEDPAKVAWLRRGLEGAGLHEGRGGGEVAVEEGAPGGAELPERAAPAGHVLYVLDPPRPEQLPAELVEALLAAPGADAVIRLPTAGLRRLAEHRGTPLADLPPLVKRTVEGWSRLLGDPRRGWTAAWWEALAGGGVDEAVEAVVERYAARLRGPARWAAPRALAGGGAAGAEHVVVTCTEPGRVLLVNGALDELRAAGLAPWDDEEGDGLVRHRPTGVIELFAASGAPEGRERVVDSLALAHRVASRFSGRTVAWRDVLADFLHTGLREEDLRRAALELRREGRALFRSLAEPGDPIAFPRGARRPAGRRRGGGRGGGDLSLPLDGDGPPPDAAPGR